MRLCPELAKDEKDSLLRHHMHLKQMAKVYAPSSILVRESDHYALDSVLVKVRSACVCARTHTRTHAHTARSARAQLTLVDLLQKWLRGNALTVWLFNDSRKTHACRQHKDVAYMYIT